MKKWLIGVFVIVILFLISCQIFIPKNITVTRTVIAKANLNGVYRFLSSDSNWIKWWPKQSSATGRFATPLLEAGRFQFIKTKVGYNSFEVSIKKNKETTPSLLHLVSH